jgi:CRP-like cAMP-binding protein
MPDDFSPATAAAAKMLNTTLRSVDFLNHLKVHEVDSLVSVMRKRTYPAGATVIKQGDKGDEFFIVASGKLSVWVKKMLKSPVQVAWQGPGKYFGEMALVSNNPRMATIKTEIPSELYVLKKSDFDKLLMSNPVIAANIRLVIQQRKANS